MQSIIILYLKPLISIVLIFIFFCFILLQRKQLHRSKQTIEHQQKVIVCKDLFLDEYARMRHDYNNMLQTLTNLIDEEDITSLKEYRNKLLETAKIYHNNNILQLEKLRNPSLLITFYHLYLGAGKSGITLGFAISGKPEHHYPHEDELYPILVECLNSAYLLMPVTNKQIVLVLRENQQGLYISFVSQLEPGPENYLCRELKSIDSTVRKHLTYNVFINDNSFTQEILISTE